MRQVFWLLLRSYRQFFSIESKNSSPEVIHSTSPLAATWFHPNNNPGQVEIPRSKLFETPLPLPTLPPVPKLVSLPLPPKLTILTPPVTQSTQPSSRSTTQPSTPATSISPQVDNISRIYQIDSEDCETASLEMALEHEGVSLSQSNLLSYEHVESIPSSSVYSDDGKLVTNADPYTNFVGNPNGSQWSTTDYGYGTYAPNIANVAGAAGGDVLWSGTGIPIGQLYQYVEQGHPAIVWVDDTNNLVLQYSATFDVNATDPNGNPVSVPYPVSGNEHAIVLAGVNTNNNEVYVLNPLHGGPSGWISMNVFQNTFATFGNMAVVIS